VLELSKLALLGRALRELSKLISVDDGRALRAYIG